MIQWHFHPYATNSGAAFSPMRRRGLRAAQATAVLASIAMVTACSGDPGRVSRLMPDQPAQGDTSWSRWRSISAMLADLADSLENGTIFGGWMRPAMIDGSLEWQ